MKKGIIALAMLVFVMGIAAACGSDNGTGSGDADFKVGMVTDAGTIDDKSFNQGTWEGVVEAAEELGLEHRYLKPNGETEAEYLQEIGNLYDAGFRFIVTPGFKFETAIHNAQSRYEDAKFVILDGAPHSGDGEVVVNENTVSIFYAEHESGFIAGVATALELQEGEAGFIGGMQIPPVQKFNWGFQQGIQYANENLGTNIEMKQENVIYQGTFDDVAAGGQIAGQMFNRGVDVIFACAGGVGVGAISEARTRVQSGEDVWIVGVDVDQYEDGIYDGDQSVILTSAMKKIGQSAYDMIQAEAEGNFPGGETLTFDVTNDGVGIPDENPNLSAETVQQVEEVVEKIKSGEITVSAEQGDLFE
ncbi:BMP family lipoprotein [Bacillus horti]|uniref:Basic membrane protein A n=1 Tax=Caldalkalibacillus horti TaxID=77523 RepID=A0ABT9VVA7_9BACI|nr:BMP family protein [Bacillus horti]MDQ0164894.1 basic membrane protein A [Bacillus horti]